VFQRPTEEFDAAGFLAVRAHAAHRGHRSHHGLAVDYPLALVVYGFDLGNALLPFGRRPRSPQRIGLAQVSIDVNYLNAVNRIVAGSSGRLLYGSHFSSAAESIFSRRLAA